MSTSAPTKNYAAVLPPAGPSWAGSLMGISLLSTLLKTHGFTWAADFFFALACVDALVIVGGWFLYRSPKFHSDVMPAWSMLSMGFIALGGASPTVVGDQAWDFMLVCWIVGTILGLISYSLYIALIVRRQAGIPTFTWGLPLVTPMVSSTAAVQLHNHYEVQLLLWIGLGLFTMAIVVAPFVFARVYLYFFSPKGPRVSLIAAPTVWIPLGLLGQSAASSQLIGAGFQNFGVSHAITTAISYGAVANIVAIPLGALAHFLFYKALLKGVTYSPTWWASTLPVGTLSLGTHFMAQATQLPWLDYASLYLMGLMAVHVVVSTVPGTIAVVRRVVDKLPAR